MEQITIGKSGVTTSRIGLGTWAIGGWMWGGSDEARSIATIQSAVERGVTLIDTAPVYGFGQSEEIVGKALAEGGLRDKVQTRHQGWPGLEGRQAVFATLEPADASAGDRGFFAAAADRRHRPLSGALAGPRNADRRNGADARGLCAARARFAQSASATTRPRKWTPFVPWPSSMPCSRPTIYSSATSSRTCCPMRSAPASLF